MTLVLTHIFQCPHVVQTVGELDHDDADVLRHREEHLAIVLEFDVLLGHILDPPELRHTVDEFHDVLAKLRFHLLERRTGILHDIMQERGTDGLVIEMKPCENVCDVQRVHDIGVARDAHLPAMCLLRIGIRPPYLLKIGICLIGVHLFQNHIEGDSPLCIVRHLHVTLSFLVPTKGRRIHEFELSCRRGEAPSSLGQGYEQSEFTENTQGGFHCIARDMPVFTREPPRKRS